MKSIIIIPARMASSRLPGKPLADICGAPMIARVADVARAADIGPVVVAAAESDIVAAVRGAGGDAVLTDPDLPSGSDRIHAALNEIDSAGVFDVVVNLQGDMPTLAPEALHALMQPLRDGPCDIATLACATNDPVEINDPNVVKAIRAEDGRALYFTRAPAPTGVGPVLHHVGVYAFRRAALEAFVAAPPSPLEQRERLEQLRALELGLRIDVALLDGTPPNGVDTPEDLAAARAYFEDLETHHD